MQPTLQIIEALNCMPTETDYTRKIETLELDQPLVSFTSGQFKLTSKDC